jgi:DNA-binding NtrC family response regulator
MEKSMVEGKAPFSNEIRILFVDDEEEITSTLRRYFSFQGYKVDVANDPYTALRKIHKENFLIVVSDIAMPGMSGVELLSRIKSYNGMIQVIMITGYVTLENILSCLRLGADDCFLKPLDDMESLRLTIDEAVAKLRKWSGLMQDITRGRLEGRPE